MTLVLDTKLILDLNIGVNSMDSDDLQFLKNWVLRQRVTRILLKLEVPRADDSGRTL